MVKFKLSVAGLATLMMCGSLFAAEPAGRVLILQGSAVAVRASQEIPLARGAQVQSGDLVKVADGSSLQIRFVDESVVALRAGTQFQIKNFKFSETGEQDRSVFGLLKGGMRTITGIIGKRNPKNYSLEADTATIGIRGTHYTAVRCAADCTNDDGTQAEDGLYGSVTDGRIVVVNQAGETEFGRDQYFMVAGPDVAPRSLIAPPGFLRERIASLARNSSANQQESAGAEITAGVSMGAVQNSESVVPAQQLLSSIGSEHGMRVSYDPAEQSGVQKYVHVISHETGGSDPSGGVVMPVDPVTPGGGTTTPGGVVVPPDTVTPPPPPPSGGTNLSFAFVESWVEMSPGLEGSAGAVEYNFSDATAASAGGYDFVNYAQSTGQSMVDLFMNAQTINTPEETIQKSAAVNTGYNSAGNVSWGRHFESGTEIASGYSWDGNYHWAIGDPVISMPTSGVFTYNAVGGTNPTNQNGQVAGTMTNRGSWRVDFGGMTIATLQPITWNMPTGTSFTVSVPQQAFQIFSYSPSTGVGVKVVDIGVVNTSCTGGCNSVSSEVGVAFMGANAEAMGASISTMNGLSEAISSVQVYQR